MGTKVVFGNKVIQEPGVNSRILSGIKNPPQDLTSGNVLIIDTGNGALFGGGAGISGSLASGKDSLYSFDNIADFQAFVRGGLVYSLANPLFQPNGPATPGTPLVSVARAATTVKADVDFTFASGGAISFSPRSEGYGANGILGDEVRAAGSITVDTAVDDGAIDAQVDAVSIGDYTIQTGDTPADAATGLADAINTAQGPQGYTATAVGNVVQILAIPNDGAAGNAKVLASVVTGTSTTTDVTFAGGVDGTKITTGYGIQLEAGVIDPALFRISIYTGSFTGLAPDGISYNEVSIADSAPILVARSIEVSSVEELVTWAAGDFEFNQNFVINSSIDGVIAAADLVTYANLNLAVGGSETYGTTQLNDLLDEIQDLDFTYILANDFGSDAQSANNTRLQAWVNQESRFDRFIFVGAQADRNNFNNGINSSVDTANYYNDEKVLVVHGGPRIRSRVTGSGYREFSALYKAAYCLGRIAGLEPQVPGTFKSINIEGEVHDMNEKERITAIDNGVLHTKFDSDVQAFVINQAINSLQENSFLINTDGTSHEHSIGRIKAQLNKEIVVNARIQLLGQEDGPNLNTLSPADVAQWLDGYLTLKVATDTDDNLIIRYENITVDQQQDTYKIDYGFVPNGPVNKLLFTGFVLDANLSA